MFSPSRGILRIVRFGSSCRWGWHTRGHCLPRARLLCSGSVRPLTCCAPPVTCCAPPPPPDVCTCTTYKPVCDTCYHQQPVVTYHDVCRTCYRQEPYCVTVPVTKVDCVTCDEGCYKMVWCPHIVTKQVPRTEYHQQIVLPHRAVHGQPARAAGDDANRSRVPRPLLSGNAHVHQAAVQSVPVLPDAVCSELRSPVSVPVAGDCRPACRRKRWSRLRPISRSSPRLRPAPAIARAGAAGTASPEPVAAEWRRLTDPYLRARAAANVWQANRNPGRPVV